ncbi:MAG TPA: MerR family transcriptional regulator [Ktedonobacteraceae bacterium]|jgi:MerR family redox-sensitive transcriptional activator SoxR|nr:MerR family transcriptional regulator [Ktedonobacteraceae bacterium]
MMLTIGEVARRAGIRASAIRYYESIQLLPPAQRSSGRRLYGPEVLERLAFIQTARQLGFSLSEILRLFDEQAEQLPLNERWQLLANQKLGEVKSLIMQAKTMQLLLERGLDCTCTNLNDCIDCVLLNCQESIPSPKDQ